VNRVSSSYQIYVNGELLENVSVSLPATANSSFVIGGTSSSTEHGFTGAIDQVKVWNVALTQAQVRSSRLATDNAGISGIVAIYDFNEQLDGSNLIDRARTDTNNQALTRTNVTRTTKTKSIDKYHDIDWYLFCFKYNYSFDKFIWKRYFQKRGNNDFGLFKHRNKWVGI